MELLLTYFSDKMDSSAMTIFNLLLVLYVVQRFFISKAEFKVYNTKMESDLRHRIEDLEERTKQNESSISELKNLMLQTSKEIESMFKQLRDDYKDINTRLSTIEGYLTKAKALG